VRDLLRNRLMKLISLKMGLAFGALALAACANDKPASDASSQTTTTSAPTSNDANESVAVATTTPSATDSNATTNATTPSSGSTSTSDTSIPQTRAHGNDSHAQTWGGSTTPQPSADGNAAGASQPPATTAPPPPNAAQNQNGGSNVTPMDQGNNASDLKVTQAIRKQVVSDSSLSFAAKNVKIITVNGRVTLKGQVNSDNEKKWIEATADKVVGNANVDNQITVKQ
jgi:hyperosmotically inducible protein